MNSQSYSKEWYYIITQRGCLLETTSFMAIIVEAVVLIIWGLISKK
jgi:hypothetical protein